MDKLDAGFNGSQKHAERFATATANIGKTAQAAGRSADGAAKKTNKFVASIARIAKYRLIRSLIRGITDAIKQGADWFYNFSKASGEGLVGFAAAMDSVKASGNTLKAQLGAAFGTLYANIAPILNSLIGLAIKFANVITMVFAKVSGASGWYRAASGADALADSVGGASSAAKEALRYLAPFDELNRLPADNGSGGGGGGGSSNGGGASYEWIDFEQYDIGQGVRDIISHITDAFNDASDWFASVDWQNIGREFYNKMSDTFSAIDFAGLAKSIFRLLGSALGATVGVISGFVSGVVSDIFGYFTQAVRDRNGDGEVTGGEIIGGILRGIVSGIGDFWSWVTDNIVDPLYRGFMDAFAGGGSGESLSDIIRDSLNDLFVGGGILLDGFRDSWTLTKAYFSDNIVRGITQFGIDAVNGFKQKWEDGINSLVQSYNNSFLADLFGKMDTIEVKMIPDLDPPVGTFYEQTKAEIDAKSASKPLGMTATSKITSYSVALTSGGTASGKYPKLTSAAQITEYSVALTKGATSSGRYPKITSNANFTAFTNGIGKPAFQSNANFVSKTVDSSLNDGYGRMKIDSVAKIKSVDKSSIGTVEVNAKAKITSSYQTQATGGVFHGGKWDSIQKFAGGGMANGSQLFWARERGPELVGTLGSHTAVMNNDQIVASVSAGVARAIAGIRFSLTGLGISGGGIASEDAMYNAMLRALNDTDALDVEVDLDGDAVYRSMVRKNRRETFRMGYNPMMANG